MAFDAIGGEVMSEYPGLVRTRLGAVWGGGSRLCGPLVSWSKPRAAGCCGGGRRALLWQQGGSAADAGGLAGMAASLTPH